MTPAELLTEDMLHIYTADVLRAFAVPRVVWWHTPNGGKRHISVAKQLKKMGTRAGVSDFVFLFEVAPRIAFLELKDADGRQEDAQKDFQRDVEAIGCPYFIARTPAEVDRVLTELKAINKSRGTLSAGAGASGRAGAAQVKRGRSRSSKGKA